MKTLSSPKNRESHPSLRRRRRKATTTVSATTVSAIQTRFVKTADGCDLEVLESSLSSAAAAPSSSRAPLLFVHGSGHAAWCWREHFMPYAAERGFESFAVSLRGRGASGPPPAGARAGGTLESHAEDVAAVARGLVGEGRRPPVVVGHRCVCVEREEKREMRERRQKREEGRKKEKKTATMNSGPLSKLGPSSKNPLVLTQQLRGARGAETGAERAREKRFFFFSFFVVFFFSSSPYFRDRVDELRPSLGQRGHGRAHRQRSRAVSLFWGERRRRGALYRSRTRPEKKLKKTLKKTQTKKNRWVSAKLTFGFITRAYARDPALCRLMFFSEQLPEEEVARLVRLLRENDGETPVLDVRELPKQVPLPGPLFPSSCSSCNSSDALLRWPAFVLGGREDTIVDERACAECAEWLEVGRGDDGEDRGDGDDGEDRDRDDDDGEDRDGSRNQLVMLDGLAHDCMLDARWREAADALLGWAEGV